MWSARGIVSLILVGLTLSDCNRVGQLGGPEFIARSARPSGPPPATSPPIIIPIPSPAPGRQTQTVAADEESATALAQQVRAGEHEALRRALLLSGIGVRESGGRLLQAAQPAQGYAFDAADVEGLAQMEKQRLTVPLTDIASMISRAIPGLAGAPVGEMLLAGFRAPPPGADPPLLFWTQFVDALGAGADVPYRLSQSAEPERMRLDAVQAMLILRRVATDLHGLAAQERRGRASARPRDPVLADATLGVQVGLVTSADSVSPLLTESPEHAEPRLPSCIAAEDLQEALVVMQKSFFIKVLEKLGERGIETAGKAAEYLEGANALLVAIKVAITSLATDIQITMSGDGPLRRTKSTMHTGDEVRTLIAQLHYTTGNWQFVNCLRHALATKGIDFGVPPNEPLIEALVEWNLVSGRTRLGRGSEPRVIWPVVVFNNAGPRIQEFGVEVRDVTNEVNSSRTDAEGKVTIDVTGAKQQREVPKDASEVRKTFDVAVNVAVKPAKWITLLLTSVEVAMGPGGWATFAGNLVLAARWTASPVYTFPVRDWGFRDYRADWAKVDPSSGWRRSFYTLKCNGPAGDWVYESKVEGSGIKLESEWKFHLSRESLAGKYTSDLHILYNNKDNCYGYGTGDVRFLDEESGPVLEFYNEMSHGECPSVHMSEDFQEDLSFMSPAKIEEGEFCSSNN
jgi:hypothetical protein